MIPIVGNGPMMRITPGIFATAAVFIQFFMNSMILKSLGILLVSMVEEFETDTWVTGTVFSLVECGRDICAPLAGPLGRRLSPRAVVMVAGGLVCLGFVTTSVSSNILQVALSLTLLIAIGQCLANVLTRSSLGEHYDVNGFALASGIARTGSSIGLVCLPPLVQLFLNTYGWRGAMLILGSIGAHLALSGALLIPPPKETGNRTTGGYQLLSHTSHKHEAENYVNYSILAFLRYICMKMGGALDLSLMKNLDFWTITLIVVTIRFSQSAWYIYFVPRAVAIGVSNEEATIIVTIAALVQLVSGILGSGLVYTGRGTSTSIMAVSVTLVAVSFFVDPWMTSWWPLFANAALFLSGMGMVITLVDVMVKELLGVDRMASAFGWMGFLSGIARPFSGFIPGWIYDHSRSYNTAFIILGAIQTTSLIPLVIKRLRTSVPKSLSPH